MPPEDEPRLSDKERQTLIAWITGEIDAVVEALKSTGGRPVVRRLNRREYQNTMSDLLGIETNFIGTLPPEGLSADGFKNNGADLRMSAMQIETYLDVTRNALDKVIVSGPAPEVFSHVIKKAEWPDSKRKGPGLFQ